jgi:thioredoxin 1
MAAITNIKSAGEWQSLLSGTSVVVADFYADWCGPCKQIAPHFERLAKEHARPRKVAFAKVNVDEQSSVAQTNGVAAMPTFKVFHNSSCIDTIKGANPSALSEAIARAVKLAGTGAPGASFKTPGRTLGGPESGRPAGAPRQAGQTMAWDVNNFINSLYIFFGLYFSSLLSFDPYKAAEGSKFNIHRSAEPARGPGQTTGARPAQRATFRTLADIGDDKDK